MSNPITIQARLFCMLTGSRFVASSHNTLVCVVPTSEHTHVSLRVVCGPSYSEIRCVCHNASTVGYSIVERRTFDLDSVCELYSTATHARWAHAMLMHLTSVQITSSGVTSNSTTGTSFEAAVSAAVAFAGKTLAYVDATTCVAYTVDGIILSATTRGFSISNDGKTEHVTFPRWVYLDTTNDKHMAITSHIPGQSVDWFTCLLCRTLART